MKTFNRSRMLFSISAYLILNLLAACKETTPAPIKPTDAHSSDVAVTWLAMQLKLTQTTPGNPVVFTRLFAYASIALYESVVPGLPAYNSLAGQLNGMPAMPTATAGLSYNWAISANAAAASINRSLFSTTSAANKVSIDSLEAVNNTALKSSENTSPEEFSRSVEFGKKIAAAVFEWSKSDGYDNATPYTLPAGAGLWVPTPPASAPAALPNWGKNRLLVAGSGTGVDTDTPPAYSEDAKSDFYLMAKEVYDISQNMTADQKAIALFWNDAADGKSFKPNGHWVSILKQVLIKENAKLDIAALAFAKMSISFSDGTIVCWQRKYKYNLLRPVTYIRNTMNMAGWSPLLVTPPFPEYPSAHAVVSAAAAQALSEVFGSTYKFTDRSYDQLGFAARSYNSFEDAAREASLSRLYGGIHFKKGAESGLVQGRKVAQNVNLLKFKK